MTASLVSLAILWGGAPPPKTPPSWNQPHALLKGDAACTRGDTVTIQFIVANFQGVTIADSKKRGLPLSFRVGDAFADPVLGPICVGMRRGEKRSVTIDPTNVRNSDGSPWLYSDSGTLNISVVLLSVARS